MWKKRPISDLTIYLFIILQPRKALIGSFNGFIASFKDLSSLLKLLLEISITFNLKKNNLSSNLNFFLRVYIT